LWQNLQKKISDFEIKKMVEISIFRTWEVEVSREGPT
jgi:hypothetical protein